MGWWVAMTTHHPERAVDARVSQIDSAIEQAAKPGRCTHRKPKTAEVLPIGKADLLWRDTSGNVAIWFLNGTKVTQSTGLGNVPDACSVLGTADRARPPATCRSG
jgi:hypothetical protein